MNVFFRGGSLDGQYCSYVISLGWWSIGARCRYPRDVYGAMLTTGSQRWPHGPAERARTDVVVDVRMSAKHFSEVAKADHER
jgi:hypothetical protein